MELSCACRLIAASAFWSSSRSTTAARTSALELSRATSTISFVRPSASSAGRRQSPAPGRRLPRQSPRDRAPPRRGRPRPDPSSPISPSTSASSMRVTAARRTRASGVLAGDRMQRVGFVGTELVHGGRRGPSGQRASIGVADEAFRECPSRLCACVRSRYTHSSRPTPEDLRSPVPVYVSPYSSRRTANRRACDRWTVDLRARCTLRRTCTAERIRRSHENLDRCERLAVDPGPLQAFSTPLARQPRSARLYLQDGYQLWPMRVQAQVDERSRGASHKEASGLRQQKAGKPARCDSSLVPC